jgi:hypothetical protein
MHSCYKASLLSMFLIVVNVALKVFFMCQTNPYTIKYSYFILISVTVDKRTRLSTCIIYYFYFLSRLRPIVLLCHQQEVIYV